MAATPTEEPLQRPGCLSDVSRFPKEPVSCLHFERKGDVTITLCPTVAGSEPGPAEAPRPGAAVARRGHKVAVWCRSSCCLCNNNKKRFCLMSLNSQACSSSELWLLKYQPINVRGNTEGNGSVWFKKYRQCEVHYALISITYGAPFMPNALFKLRPSFYISD